MAVNWKLLEGRLTAELWQAVFLSQDIEPATPSGYGYPESLMLRTLKRATDSQAEEFSRRVDIAYDHLITGRLAAVVRNEKEHESRVELTVFRQWAESLEKPWTFPEQFPRAAPIEARRETGAKQSMKTTPESESVASRNLRWASREAAALEKDSSRGVRSQVAREISETEAMKLETVKKGIRAGRAALAELTRQGGKTKKQAVSESTFLLEKHFGKRSR
jgi:hypothetical protein